MMNTRNNVGNSQHTMHPKNLSKKSFSLSIGLHVLLLILLSISLLFPPDQSALNTSQNVKIIEAVAINNEPFKTPEMKKQSMVRQNIPNEVSSMKSISKKASRSATKKIPIQPYIETKKTTIVIKKVTAKVEKKPKLTKTKTVTKPIQKIVDKKTPKHLVQHAAESKSAQNNTKIATQSKPTEQSAVMKKAMEQQTLEENALEQQLDTDQHMQTMIDHYKTLILNAIGQHWIMPKNVDPQMTTELLVRLAPGGIVLRVEMTKSSGNDALDQSVINAIWKSSPLPVPADESNFESFRLLHLTVKPEGFLH